MQVTAREAQWAGPARHATDVCGATQLTVRPPLTLKPRTRSCSLPIHTTHTHMRIPTHLQGFRQAGREGAVQPRVQRRHAQPARTQHSRPAAAAAAATDCST
jgi:hypothetical protein